MDGFQTPFKRFDASDRIRSRVLRMWALRRSTSLKSLAMQEASSAFFASYLIRIASHHFNKMIGSSPSEALGSDQGVDEVDGEKDRHRTAQNIVEDHGGTPAYSRLQRRV
jgi:hypothetical protein